MGCCENSQQFVRFVRQRFQPLLGNEFSPSDEFQPEHCFVRFFYNDAQLCYNSRRERDLHAAR